MPSSPWRTNRCVVDEDSGHATVAAAGFAAVMVLLCGIIAWHVGALVAGAQAQRAADLAAVAAAYRFTLGEGSDTACVTARYVAELNDATIRACTISGEDVIVEATVRGSTAQTRAGPM